MKATLKLEKEAIFEAIRAYVKENIPNAEIAEIESTGFYGTISVTVMLADKERSPSPSSAEALEESSGAYLKELD